MVIRKNMRLVGCFCVVLLLLSLIGYAKEKDVIENIVGEAEELEISADEMQQELETGLFKATGNVKLNYGKLHLTSNELSVNRETTDFKAAGNVHITSDDGSSWEAPAVSGNLEKRQLHFGPYRLDSPVWHSAGEGGTTDDQGSMKMSKVWLSTCDRHEPHYCLYASSVKYNEDKTFSAKHVMLKFGGVPVFYFPYLAGNADGTSGFIIRPGYSGKRGAYLRLGRIWHPVPNSSANLYIDLMSKRGVGLGSESEYASEKRDVETLLYGLKDSDPPETERGYNRRWNTKDERWRINAYWREKIADGLTLRANVDKLSDIDMLEDWFKSDYRRKQQPKSFVDFTYDSEVFSLGLAVRPRVNDFYTVVESLPELRLEVPRWTVPYTPIQYASSTQAGYYSLKWRKFDRERQSLIPDIYVEGLYDDPHNYESWRLHSQHFLYLPISLWDKVTFTPRGGFAATYYSRSSRRRVTKNDLADMLEVDNPDKPYAKERVAYYDADGGEIMRMAFETGAELRSSLYGDWFAVTNDSLEINGLRHVLEPYVNYTYAPDPSHDRDHIYYFDDIDRLERQHFIRLGVDQRLLTRREQGTAPILRLQSYIDFHFDRGEESERHPGDLGNRLDFIPREDLSFWAGLVHDIGEGDIQRGEFGYRIGKEDELNFSTRYIYRNEHISRSVWSMGSSLVDISGESSYLKKRFEAADVIVADLFIPLNSITSLEVSAEYDFEKSRLSEHRYVLRRQLHCWTMAVGVGWDNNDFEAMIMFQLTAFPKIKIDLNM
ncbi:MAG: LPS-assembly protein LptD [Victivallales bacterium]|nr:LPS-assembly protein LptD [Victivallales bacterium]